MFRTIQAPLPSESDSVKDSYRTDNADKDESDGKRVSEPGPMLAQRGISR